jgi:hypothetical protein
MYRRSILPFLTLFTSASTLICCALPALFVTIGAGAAFAGLVSQFPQLIWLSEHKRALFILAGFALLMAGLGQWQARNRSCPMDAGEARACAQARQWSAEIFWISVLIYLVGAGFAFLPVLFGTS